MRQKSESQNVLICYILMYCYWDITPVRTHTHIDTSTYTWPSKCWRLNKFSDNINQYFIYIYKFKNFKKVNIFQKLRRNDTYFFIRLNHRQPLQSAIPTKTWKVFQIWHANSREQTWNLQTTYLKIAKLQENWDRQPTKRSEKRYNLRSSTYQIATLYIVLIIWPKFCPTTKGNVFDIKSETQEFTKKLKQRFCRIEYNDESLVKK